MRTVIANAIHDGCCTFTNKLEFIFDSLEKQDLEDIIQFLYVVTDVLCCPLEAPGGLSVTSSPSRRNFQIGFDILIG